MANHANKQTNPDRGRPNAIAISDPFGKHPQFGDQNKIERVKFGGESMRFKKFYRKLKKLVSRDKTKDNYFFQKATFTELDAAGVLPLQGIGDYNNNLVDTKL